VVATGTCTSYYLTDFSAVVDLTSKQQCCFTSSPYQRDLQKSLDKSQKKNDQSSAKKCKIQIFKNPKDDVPKCKIRKTSGKSTVSKEGKTAVVQKRKIHPKIRGLENQQPEISSDESSDQSVHFISADDEDSADEECIYCSLPYRLDKTGENWIRCIKFLRWVHESCAGVEKNDWKTYLCEYCTR
jgi:hypothetical protein